MAELFNLHTAPLTVTDGVTGKRITIQRGHSALVSGDFRDHLFVKAKLLRAEHDESDEALTQQNASETAVDIAALRTRYEEVLGKKAPSAAKAETLQKAIDEVLAQQPNPSGSTSETE